MARTTNFELSKGEGQREREREEKFCVITKTCFHTNLIKIGPPVGRLHRTEKRIRVFSYQWSAGSRLILIKTVTDQPSIRFWERRLICFGIRKAWLRHRPKSWLAWPRASRVGRWSRFIIISLLGFHGQSAVKVQGGPSLNQRKIVARINWIRVYSTFISYRSRRKFVLFSWKKWRKENGGKMSLWNLNMSFRTVLFLLHLVGLRSLINFAFREYFVKIFLYCLKKKN